MEEIGLNDIEGIYVGNAEYREGPTGCTVIICEKGAVAGVDVRGGAPGTRETDLLKPENLVEKIHSVVLSGGSAYGLDAATGVMECLEEKDIGFNTGVVKVPIVCSAVLFDLNLGNPKIRPDKSLGYKACINAYKNDFKEGSFGAGTGATVGKLYGLERAMKGGLGCYGLQAGDLKVLSIVAVNALGDIINTEKNEIVAGLLDDKMNFIGTENEMLKNYSDKRNLFGQNTTIGIVITNAKFTKSQANKIASMAHNGYGRAIRPSHSTFDGDTIFTMNTGDIEADINAVGILSAITMEKAILRAVKFAESESNVISYKDIRK
ncbi:P1 family peptidase [Clostridium sp. D2Q-11]|uniref:P1 family peptidase n=1 Tax=Anaeromonas frigoriresistens TaxID=2683708 RepID=A0A942UW95_9FIRM|nr:P1 family peptidase [Anaeromonas frigoriresistens]MBS4537979.1 P1 family peptidase [Anaeromonas frigoriresistens]